MKFPKRSLIAAVYYPATLVLLPVLVYFVTLEIRLIPLLDTPAPGTIAIYWPEESGTYSPTRSVWKNYPAGESAPELLVPTYPGNRMLRLDPLDVQGTMTLRGLTIERFGVRSVLAAEDLAARLADSVDAKVKKVDGGLEITSTSGDPQLLLRDLPEPPFPIFFIFLFILLYGLLLASGYYFFKYPPKRPQLHLPFALVLVLACNNFGLPLEIALPACALLVLSFQHTAAALAVFRFSRPPASRCLALAFVASLLGLIYYPCWTTLSLGETHRDSLKSIYATFAKNENRSEAAGKFIKEVEESFTRSFSLRDTLIELNARIKIFGLGFSPTPKILLGKNGMFFEGYGEQRVEEDDIAHFDNVTDYMGLIPLSDKELEAWRICLEERYYWLKERGIDYIFALAPSKAMIYTENLPDLILETRQALQKPSRYDQLVAYLKQHPLVPVVDLSAPLRLAKQEAEAAGTLSATPLYYRTDFHWTYYGAYIAYRAIVEEIRQRYPAYGIEPSPLTDFSVTTRQDWVHSRFIYALGLNPTEHRNETYLTFLPRPHTVHASISDFGTKGIDDYSLPEAVYNNYDGHRIATRELHNPQGKLGTIFVIGDSFAEKYFGFFSAHSQKTVNFRTVYNFFTKPYQTYGPDLVIQEILNMYLLQRPPTNPPEVRQARITALAGKKQLAKGE